jgi:hypothetical protein
VLLLHIHSFIMMRAVLLLASVLLLVAVATTPATTTTVNAEVISSAIDSTFVCMMHHRSHSNV